MKKMNMVSKFKAVKALLNGEAVEGFSVAQAQEFLDERIEQVNKKNASGGGERKPTKTQLENEVIKEQIVVALQGVEAPGLSIGEIGKAVGIDSNQKITALVSSMLTVRKGEPNPDGCVIRTMVKGKAHFALAK